MKNEHQPLLHLVEFTFLAAEVKPHFQAFGHRVLEGRCGRRGGFQPQGSNADSCGMPPESLGFTDIRLVQRLFQERVDGEICAGHVHQLRELLVKLQRAERLLCVADREAHAAGDGRSATAYRTRA